MRVPKIMFIYRPFLNFHNSTQSSTMSLYPVGLRLSFTETEWPKHVLAWQCCCAQNPVHKDMICKVGVKSFEWPKQNPNLNP